MTTAQATRELEAARRALAAARSRFESEPSDLAGEWVRRAQIHYEDMVAVAQEWAVLGCPDEDWS
ncbi:MAG TPA: hypothetical protein VI028_11625 [Solirubrobacterales bacterium]